MALFKTQFHIIGYLEVYGKKIRTLYTNCHRKQPFFFLNRTKILTNIKLIHSIDPGVKRNNPPIKQN